MYRLLSAALSVALASAVGMALAVVDFPSVELAGLSPGIAVACEGDCPDWAPATCPPIGINTPDPAKTSSLVVNHKEDGTGLWVEPNTTDTWHITATWRSPSFHTGGVLHVQDCPCDDEVVTATVEVAWVSNTWTATCTAGCNSVNGPIYRVLACGGSTCSSGGVGHSGKYTLIVDLEYDRFFNCTSYTLPVPFYLYKVDYVSRELDDGNVFTTSPCSEGSSVSPINEPYLATDNGPYECDFSCNAVIGNGPTVTIEYQ